MYDTPRSLDLAVIARSIMLVPGLNARAQFLERSDAPPRIIAIAKAAVAAGTTSNETWAGALSPNGSVVSAFLESLQSRSVFAWALMNGMARAPLQSRAVGVTVAASASIVAEGGPKAVTRLSLSGNTIQQRKAVAIVVLSAETLNGSTPGGLTLVDNELRKAISLAVDSDLFDVIIDSGSPQYASSGNDADAMRRDLKALLDAVNTTGAGALVWAGSPDVANAASLIADPHGAMTPLGGELLGLPFIVTAALPAGTLALVDASGLAGEAGGIDLSQSTAASVQMRDDPANGATALVSLWQTNSVGVKAEQAFGVERFRNNAAAIMTGIEWGDPAASG